MGQVVDAQALFNRVRMWLAGVQYKGHRDLYEQFGYTRSPDFRNYVAAYYRQGIAKRVIDAPVLGVWADPPQLSAQPEFNTAWEEIVEEQKLWHNIIRLDKLAGLGRFAVMVVGFDDGQKLDTPIYLGTGRPRKRNVIYLQPYHEGAISIHSYDDDKTSPRFGKPVMYNINPGRLMSDGMASPLSMGMNTIELRQPFNCHYTRLVHVADGMLEDSIFGTPRLEVAFNDISDILKVSGGSAETFWLIANRGMQVNVDKDMEISPEDAKDLQQEIEDYQHQLRRFIRTRGVDVKELGSDPVNPEAVFKMLVQLVSAGTGIPQLVLLGASVGQISSRNDRANWADRCAERVTEYAQPVVLKGVLDCFINAGALPVPENLEVDWPEAFKMDPLERAQTSAQMARSAVNLTKAATIGGGNVDEAGAPIPTAPLFSPEEMRKMVSFGKHPPVFDDMPSPQGSVPSTGSPEATPSSKSDAGTAGPGGSTG